MKKIAEAAGSAEAIQADVTQETDIKTLFSKVNRTLARAIYSAGNNTPGAIKDMTADYFEAVGVSPALVRFCLCMKPPE